MPQKCISFGLTLHAATNLPTNPYCPYFLLRATSLVALALFLASILAFWSHTWSIVKMSSLIFLSQWHTLSLCIFRENKVLSVLIFSSTHEKFLMSNSACLEWMFKLKKCLKTFPTLLEKGVSSQNFTYLYLWNMKTKTWHLEYSNFTLFSLLK